MEMYIGKFHNSNDLNIGDIMSLQMLGTQQVKRKEENPYRIGWMPYAGGGSGSNSSTSSTPVTRSIAANGNLLVTDEYLLIDATTDKAFTLDTPTDKKKYYLKITTGNGNITLTPASGTIDGGANYIFSGDQSSLGLLFDGTNWWTFLS
jgi:hypothetical protein